jgi:putative membrane protein
MRRLLVVLVLVVVGFGTTGLLFAQTDEEHGRSIDAVLADIRQEQNIGKNESINPDKVSDGLLEELGEAAMSYMIPNPRQHEWMDEMMGGEGSENLSAMHRLMGYRYLSDDGGFMGSMMMGGTFGSRSSGWGSMMGSGVGRSMMGYGTMGYGGWLLWLVLIVLVAAVIVLAVVLSRSRRGGVGSGRNAIALLKQRYASGEIDRAEYQRIKEDLQG